MGEEITTRGGHLLALVLERPVPLAQSLRWSIEAVHDQGGLAIPAHPLVPYPLCAQGSVLRRLLDDDNPAVHPDAIETFNPTALGKYRHGAVVRFAAEHGLAQVGNSDAHIASAIGACWTTFPGRTPDDYRRGHRLGPTRPPRRASTARSASSASTAASCASTRADGARRRRPGAPGRDGPRPRATPAARSARRASTHVG